MIKKLLRFSVSKKIAKRFAGLLPVVVDAETGGIDPTRDALLELAACPLVYSDQNKLKAGSMWHYHIEPFMGSNISKESLEVTQIIPDHPFRFAVTEANMLQDLSQKVKTMCDQYHCRRAVLVGHNAAFDLSFLNAAYERVGIRSPFHRFVTIDSTSLCAVWYKETVLARAMMRAKISFNTESAHSALYDCEKTAELVCKIINLVDHRSY